MQRVIALIVSVLAVMASVALTASPAAAVTTSANLIKDPNAERDTCGGGGFSPPSLWNGVQGAATLVCYGSADGFPASDSPGPPSRGLAFFAGGSGVEKSTLRQTRPLSAFAGAIAAGQATFKLSGYFGGFSYQNDRANLSIVFLDSERQVVGSTTTIGNVNATDRNNITGLLLRSTTGSVPVGAAFVRISVAFTRYAGTYNDGYADALVLKIVTP